MAEDAHHRRLGDVFADWGLTTPEAVIEARSVSQDLPLIASGGVRTGLDVARLVALGATVAGMASPVLRAADESEDACLAFLKGIIAEIKAALFGVGASDLRSFRTKARIYSRPPLTDAQV